MVTKTNDNASSHIAIFSDTSLNSQLLLLTTHFLPICSFFALQRTLVQRCLYRPMEQNLDAHQRMQQCTMIQCVSSRVMMAIKGLGLKQGDANTMELGVDKTLLAKVSIINLMARADGFQMRII